MTEPAGPRAPRAFIPDDPSLTIEPETASYDATEPPVDASGRAWTRPTQADLTDGMQWGTILISTAAALATLATGVWFARFVSVALSRQDWIGWAAWGLAAMLVLCITVMVLRELIGLFRLARLGRLRRDIDRALKQADVTAERRAVRKLIAILSERDDVKWGVARLSQHAGDVRDSGDLLRLAEREIVMPLDGEARRVVLRAAKRVSTVSAVVPLASLTVLFIVFENLRMLRALGAVYGGRPGFIGGLRLAHTVITHIAATGLVAFTDDLLGQFLGQDVLHRLSRRLGEAAFNGTMTARIGSVAIQVTRPLPYQEAPPVRARDFLAELFRKPTARDIKESGGP